jgi:hypothetical protein
MRHKPKFLKTGRWRNQSSKTWALFMKDKLFYIQKFKDLYQQKTGVVVSDKLANEYFEKLILLVESIYKPIVKDNGR